MSDDLISRQAAIETLLKGKIDEDESLVECPAECNAMIDCAIEDIKALPSVQKWIPVTEQLPEENKPVLVTHHGKYQAFVSVDWIDPYTHEWNRTCNVTAWQPMPMPYAEVK